MKKPEPKIVKIPTSIIDFLKIIINFVLLFKLQMRRSASWFGILSFIPGHLPRKHANKDIAF